MGKSVVQLTGMHLGFGIFRIRTNLCKHSLFCSVKLQGRFGDMIRSSGQANYTQCRGQLFFLQLVLAGWSSS
jgi:hypothetical protein